MNGPGSGELGQRAITPPKKVAFVLAGGGSRGSIQVGMVKRVIENGVLPDIVTGVSIGACNAFFIAQDKIEELESLWLSIKGNEDVFRKRWFAAAFMFFGWQWGMPSLFKPGPAARRLAKLIRRTSPDAFKAELRIGAVDLVTGNYVSVNQNHPMLDRFIAGATAIPLAFPAIRIKKKEDPELAGLYVDGCVRNLTPIGEAIRLGADVVHIFLTGSAQLQPQVGSYRVWQDHVERTIDIMLHELFMRDIENVLTRNELASALAACGQKPKRPEYRHVELHVYEPEDGRLQGLLDFDPEAIRDAIHMGYHLGDKPKRNADLFDWISDDNHMPFGHYYVDFINGPYPNAT